MVKANPLLAAACLLLLTASCLETSAQDPFGGSRPRARREAPRAAAGSQATAQPGGSGEQSKPDGEEGKKAGEEGKKEGEKKEGESGDSIKRPDKPPRVPDPREFDVEPDEDGRILFNFYGQGWPDVLQWLANISGYSLDWQELPKDYVNVTTTRKYTIPEAHDLFNRLLLERGYTMIRDGRILTVIRISKVDPSLLTRVQDESELMDLPAHDFVKITFKLPDQLKADQAAKDVTPLLSPHAKVQPLLATNRLLVIDAVVNLREVSQLVNAEHAAATDHIVPREFRVRFARADRVADQVMILLGLDPSSRRTPQELQVEQQKLQLFQQMQQRGKDVTKFLRPGSAPTVYLAVNDRNNSILANAPPKELRMIQLAIEKLDVPTGGFSDAIGSFGGSFDGGFGGGSSALTMAKYPLATISPQSILDTLEAIGDLDPRTRIRTDTQANMVFANATPRDHEKIKSLIDRLDGTGRELQVVWLRRLPALAVAETLQKLMVGEKEEQNSGRRSYYSSYYSRYYGREEEKKDQGEFRVDADIEQNRLLLWCNESEFEEVKKFLERLGEIPGRSGNPNTVRFLSPRGDEATLKLLEQLRKAWRGPNKLDINLPEPEEEEVEEEPEPKSKVIPNEPKTTAVLRGSYLVASRTTDSAVQEQLDIEVKDVPEEELAAEPESAPQAAFAEPTPAESEQQRAAASDAPGISITVTPDGRIMLHSLDPGALDEIEDLMASLSPPAPNFKVYYLKYGYSPYVTINLEEYFEEEEDFNTDENWMRAWYGMDFQASETRGTGLSAQRKIRFIYDIDTNSVLVANASPSQLATVDRLIEIYDKAPSDDAYSARAFKLFKLEYSKADAVAKTIKEVFRDLLSSKDKDFERQQQGEKQGSNPVAGYYRIYGSGLSDDDDKKPKTVKASFEGALSIGVDEVSNSIIVSAQEEWMPSIGQMIEYLDKGARPQTNVAVHRVKGAINSVALQAALADILGEAWLGSQPPASKRKQSQQQPQQPQQPMQPQQQPGTNGNQPATAEQSSG